MEKRYKKEYTNTWMGDIKIENHFEEGFQSRIDELMVSIKKELDIEFQKDKQRKRL